MSFGTTLGYYRVIIFYYLIGGLTFLPLCAILLISWFYLTSVPYQSITSVASSSEPLGDVEFSEERKREALDLAVSNAEAEKLAEKERGKEEAIGTSTAPASAKRVKPLPSSTPTARPHKSGWLVVRRQFESDAVVSALLSQSGQDAANSSANGAGKSEESSIQAGKEAEGDRGPGYMSSLYRGMLKYRNNRSSEQERRLAGENTNGSGASTPDSGPEERKGDTTSVKASKQVAGTGSRESFYCILKASVLYLYSSDDTSNSTTECHAAIDLRSKRVSMYISGVGDTEGEPDDFPDEDNHVAASGNTFDTESSTDSDIKIDSLKMSGSRKAKVRDGELFTKRNAIRVISTAAGSKLTDGKRRYAQWFIFCRTATVLEDWYHALLHASMLPENNLTQAADPIGPVFSPMDMLSLLTSLDTLPDPIPLRWLNALIGRIFFSIYRTAWLEDYVTRKIMKKISRVKTPGFLSDIRVKEVDLGRSPPAFSRPMLKSLTGDGEASMEVAIHYTGCLRLTISTVLTISLGSRFKPYNVPLVLAVIVNSLEGNLLLHIKQPPSNRIWFGFTKLPKMDISVEPVVSERKVQWGMVKKLIEGRIRELLTESLVVPNMDDIPFFDSRPLQYRGGIWSDASKRPDQSSSTGVETVEHNETPIEQKSKSSPASVLNMTTSDEGAKSTGAEIITDPSSTMKRRAAPPANGETSNLGVSNSSSLSTSPAAAGLSTLLAREIARGQATQLESDDFSKTSSNVLPASKRKSWFAGRSATAMPGTPSNADTKRTLQQQSSLAWGNASLALPNTTESTEGSRSAPVSAVESISQDASQSQATTSNHQKTESISSVATDTSSLPSADTAEFHASLMTALNGESKDLKTPMAEVPTVNVHDSTDTQVTEQGNLTETDWKEDLKIPASLSPEQRSLNDESSDSRSIASSNDKSLPPTTARKSPVHGFAPPPSRGATVRKQQDQQRQGSLSQFNGSREQANLTAGISNAGNQSSSRQVDHHGLSPSATNLDGDETSSQRSATSSANLLQSWNKAKASMADKESRQAAAKDAKDALKRGWANWNAKRNASPMGSGTPNDQMSIKSDQTIEEVNFNPRSRRTSWLASSPPDPASLGIGFDVDSVDRSQPLSSVDVEKIGYIAEPREEGTSRSRIRNEEGSSSRTSSVSGRTPYRDHRAGKQKELKSENSSRASSPPPAPSAVWDATVPAIAAPVPAARRNIGNNNLNLSDTQPQHSHGVQTKLSSSPSSIRKLSNAAALASTSETGAAKYSFVPSQGQTTTSISRADFAAEIDEFKAEKVKLQEAGSLTNNNNEVDKSDETATPLVESLPTPVNPDSQRKSSFGSIIGGANPSPSPPNTTNDLLPTGLEPIVKGIKQQPTRSAMMAVPGIPSMQKTNRQSFSAAPETSSTTTTVAETSSNSPRLGLGNLMSRIPSFKTSSGASTPDVTAPASVAPTPLEQQQASLSKDPESANKVQSISSTPSVLATGMQEQQRDTEDDTKEANN